MRSTDRNAFSVKPDRRNRPALDTPFSPAAARPVAAIVIGASAGGIDALMSILPHLPATFRLPIAVVLHLARERDSRLAEVFGAHMAIPVLEAADKETIRGGTLYFAPADYHLAIEVDRSFSLSGEPPLHFSRPAIDILMESAAAAYGPALAGILLTGANEDGARGMQAIRQQGGLTIVQDPQEAQIGIMPQAAIDLMQPDLILPLKEIHNLLLTLDKQYVS
jgi:two-component system chemotaxis response regulator CheB